MAGWAVAGLLLIPSLVCAQEHLTLSQTYDLVEAASLRWFSDDLALEQARLAYRRARAIIYPVVNLSAPVSVDSTLRETFTTEAGASTLEVERTGAYALTVSPSVTVLQALPTGGTLSATISDSVGIADPGEFTPESVGDSYPVNDRADHLLRVGVDLDQPLYFQGNPFRASLETAENAWARARLDRDKRRNQIASEAAELYYQIQYLGYSRALVSSRFLAAGRRLATIEREFELGMHTRSVLLQAQLSVKKAEIDLYDAQRALDRALTEFRGLYGLEDDAQLGERVDAFPALNPRALSDSNPGANPDVGILRLAAADAENAIILYNTERAPRLSAGAELTYADRSEADLPQRSTGLGGSIVITANLFDGRTTRLRRDELERASARAELELRQAELSVQRELDAAIEDLERNRRYMQYLEAAVEVSQYEFEKGVQDRDLGVITDRELQDLELSLETARLEVARAIMEDNLFRIRLLATRGEDIMKVVRDEGARQ